MRTLRRKTRVEYHIKRSIFIGIGDSVMTEEEAKKFISSVKQQYSDATHVAWAYVINSIEGFSDAGEPSGTAGPPILRALKGEKITHGVICVIRYYGGIKLGKRGLIDAYGHTAKLVIEKAGVYDAVPGYEVQIVHPYNVKIDGVLRSLGIDVRNLTPRYEEVVKWKLNISQDVYELLESRLSHMDGVKMQKLREVLVEDKSEV